MSKLVPHIGNQVTFTNPTTGEPHRGRILDEIWAQEPFEFPSVAPSDAGWREGAFVTQLIEWDGGHRSVRFTYYLRPERGGEEAWYFAGQYAPSMDLAAYQSLLTKLDRTRPEWRP
jgi:hypothetical protein